MIELSECSAAYGATAALSRISLRVDDGRTACIVGPSGCGKTTLLMICAGLKAPVTGSVLMDGKPIAPGERAVGLILQQYGLFPWFTVQANVELGLKIRGDVSARERSIIAVREIGRVGLHGSETLFPGQLSGGQQQRVAIARAYALEPRLLLMDEPFSALDALTRESLQDLLLVSAVERGTSVLLVTHSIEEAVYLGHVVWVLAGSPGRIVGRFENSRQGSRGFRQESEILQALCGGPRAHAAGKLMDNTGLRAGKRLGSTLGAAGGLVLLAAAWWVLAKTVPRGFIPGPVEVLQRFLVLLPGVLAVHAAASLGRVLSALALTLVTAVPAGMAIGRSPVLDRLFSPVLYVLYPVPKIALLPILMLLFGLGDSSKILIIFLVLFFQVLIAVRDAARHVAPQFVLSLRSLGGTSLHAARHVIFPALVPALLSSIRIGAGTALAVLFFSETFGTSVGLGWFVMESWMRMSYVDMFAGILALGLLGLGIFLAVDFFQRRFCRWESPETATSASKNSCPSG